MIITWLDVGCCTTSHFRKTCISIILLLDANIAGSQKEKAGCSPFDKTLGSRYTERFPGLSEARFKRAAGGLQPEFSRSEGQRRMDERVASGEG